MPTFGTAKTVVLSIIGGYLGASIAVATAQSGTPQLIVARGFMMVNNANEPAIIMGSDKTGNPILTLKSSDERATITLRVDYGDNGPAGAIRIATGGTGASLVAEPTGAHCFVRSTKADRSADLGVDDKSALVLVSNAGYSGSVIVQDSGALASVGDRSAKASIGATKSGAMLHVTDGKKAFAVAQTGLVPNAIPTP